ncbi:FCD domain-containing protein (plasmid) [Pseudomonas silvicola]|nr:FCD domain-containing protein [Pseudomonas silvicola]
MLHALEVRRIINRNCARCTACKHRRPAGNREQRLIEMERVHLAVGSAGAEDWAFHTSIYRASGNPLLLQMLNGIYDSMCTPF